VVELLGYPEARLPEISGFTSHIAAVAGENLPLIDRGSLIPIKSVQGIALRIHIANCGASLPSLSQFFTSFVLQVMDSPCQLSQSTRLARVSAVLKLSYCTLGNFGLA